MMTARYSQPSAVGIAATSVTQARLGAVAENIRPRMLEATGLPWEESVVRCERRLGLARSPRARMRRATRLREVRVHTITLDDPVQHIDDY